MIGPSSGFASRDGGTGRSGAASATATGGSSQGMIGSSSTGGAAGGGGATATGGAVGAWDTARPRLRARLPGPAIRHGRGRARRVRAGSRPPTRPSAGPCGEAPPRPATVTSTVPPPVPALRRYPPSRRPVSRPPAERGVRRRPARAREAAPQSAEQPAAPEPAPRPREPCAAAARSTGAESVRAGDRARQRSGGDAGLREVPRAATLARAWASPPPRGGAPPRTGSRTGRPGRRSPRRTDGRTYSCTTILRYPRNNRAESARLRWMRSAAGRPGSPGADRSCGTAASTGRRSRPRTRCRWPARGGSSRCGTRCPCG